MPRAADAMRLLPLTAALLAACASGKLPGDDQPTLATLATREVAVDKGYVQAPVLEAGVSAPISIMLNDAPAHARMAFEVQARPLDGR